MASSPARERLAQMIADAVRQSGKSNSAIGGAVGVSHVSVGNWIAGTNRPDVKRAQLVAGFLGIDSDDLVAAIQDIEMVGAIVPRVDGGKLAQSSNVSIVQSIDPHRLGPSDIPVYGVVVGGDDADFYLNGEVSGRVKRPPGIETLNDVYALHVVGSSMSPRFKDGELVYVHRRTPAVGDDVVIQLKAVDAASPPRGFLKFLIRRNGSHVICGQYTPEMEVEYDREQIISIDRVIPWRELLGQ